MTKKVIPTAIDLHKAGYKTMVQMDKGTIRAKTLYGFLIYYPRAGKWLYQGRAKKGSFEDFLSWIVNERITFTEE